MPVASHRSRDIGRPLTRSLLAVISETTSPAPRVAANRRNGASVTPDIGASRTRLATSISPIFNGLRRKAAGTVTDFSFFWRRFIATAGTHSEHKSCAVKLHAYTLDNSDDLASAVQQNMPFPQLLGIVLFSSVCVIWAVRQRASCSSTTQNHQLSSPMPKTERTAAILVAAGRGLR